MGRRTLTWYCRYAVPMHATMSAIAQKPCRARVLAWIWYDATANCCQTELCWSQVAALACFWQSQDESEVLLILTLGEAVKAPPVNHDHVHVSIWFLLSASSLQTSLSSTCSYPHRSRLRFKNVPQRPDHMSGLGLRQQRCPAGIQGCWWHFA